MNQTEVTIIQKIFFAFSGLVMILLSGCSGADNDLLYMVMIGSESADFNERDVPRIGGGSWGGRCIVYVNGNPASIGNGGVSSFSINHWISSGKNELSFEGSFSKKLYVVVVAKEPDHDHYLLTKMVVRPQERERMTFEVDTHAITPAVYTADMTAYDPEDAELELIGRLQWFLRQIDEEKWDELWRFYSEGEEFGSQAAYHLDQSAEKQAAKAMHTAMRKKLKVTQWEDLEFIWGENSVMVLQECRDFGSGAGGCYLFTTRNGNLGVPPLVFTRVNGDWIVWGTG